MIVSHLFARAARPSRGANQRARARSYLSPPSLPLLPSRSRADGVAEQAVFIGALETTLGSDASVAVPLDGGCSNSRRRDLLQTDIASLIFDVTITGGSASYTTADSLSALVTAAVDSGDFASALSAAQTATGYLGTAMDSITTTGASVDYASPPSSEPTVSAMPAPAPSPAPATPPATPATPAPVVSEPVVEASGVRVAPGLAIAGALAAAVLATV